MGKFGGASTTTKEPKKPKMKMPPKPKAPSKKDPVGSSRPTSLPHPRETNFAAKPPNPKKPKIKKGK